MIDLTTYALLRKQIAADAKATGDALALKLTEPSTGLAVGKYFRIAAIDESGHAVLEAVDLPSAPVKDVQVAGTSIVADGVANVPIADLQGSYGVIRGNADYGYFIDNGAFACGNYTAEQLSSKRANSFIGKGSLYSLLSTPSKMPALTEAEQAAARERIGLPGEWELIETAKITEEINVFTRSAEPDGTPYNFCAMVIRADFSEVPSDITYNSSTYAFMYNGLAYYNYFTSRKIKGDRSLWGFIDCSGKCINSMSFTASNSGVSLVDTMTGFMNTVGINSKCQSFKINRIEIGNLFPPGVRFTIWGVRA